MSGVRLEFERRPSALVYMARALLPSPGLRPGAPFPRLAARWRGMRASARQRRDFAALCGLVRGDEPPLLPLLLQHTLSLRLQLALLTHPAFPVPIWRMLQVRNRLALRRAIDPDAPLELAAQVAAHRVLEKGLEVDLHCSASARGGIVWEGVNTFYARGRFGPADAAAPAAPVPGEGAEQRWRMDAGGRLRFAALSGDYNGVHLADGYARLLGFPRAFAHPQRILGHCLARLRGALPQGALGLDAWLKGPVPYGAEVRLRAQHGGGEMLFALAVPPEERPAIVARVYAGAA